MRLFLLVCLGLGLLAVSHGCDDSVAQSGSGDAGDPSVQITLAAQTVEVEAIDGEGERLKAPEGMVWVPAGEFEMGWDGAEGRPDERPAHQVYVDGFYMDVTEVTNAQFRKFVEATGYVTTAEQPVDWEELKKQLPPGTPKPDDAVLSPGSLVFTPPNYPVPLQNVSLWWTWTIGASWQHPSGPGSSIEGKDDYPVVHISWFDAMAYAKWAGKRLPTEAEWERAARHGNDGKMFAWGDTFKPEGKYMANTFQGSFPYDHRKEDGFAGIAPVKQYPPNELGLYDMAGNVWEWTSDKFNPDTYRLRIEARDGMDCCFNPMGPTDVADPRNPFAEDSRVQKGGSFLCHVSYCSSYRPSAKMASPPDTGLGHLGFRLVKDRVDE